MQLADAGFGHAGDELQGRSKRVHLHISGNAGCVDVPQKKTVVVTNTAIEVFGCPANAVRYPATTP